ncbi:MAG: class I SAM-dependent methyltransferase [Desmonostoc vinosum HA7617-LM4]|jgi:hypothetical protein|nr:class I SAM-dependent methyltransferase [Desmonostoc vinosum HA7617-LM4]
MFTKFTKQVKNMLKKTPLIRWEYIDQNIEVRKKQYRIQFIEQFLPKNGIGAELGVFKGHLSPILLEYTNAKKLHLVDPWYTFKPLWQWASGNKSTVDGLIKVLRSFKKELEDGRIVVHVGDDLQVLPTFPDKYFDWVYIDTSHAYEQTKQELQILASKVKDDGVIAGDDWQPDTSHRHHGVCKAVNEFIVSEKYEIIYSNEHNLQWAIKKG